MTKRDLRAQMLACIPTDLAKAARQARDRQVEAERALNTAFAELRELTAEQPMNLPLDVLEARVTRRTVLVPLIEELKRQASAAGLAYSEAIDAVRRAGERASVSVRSQVNTQIQAHLDRSEAEQRAASALQRELLAAQSVIRAWLPD